jgi:hypothetical protein
MSVAAHILAKASDTPPKSPAGEALHTGSPKRIQPPAHWKMPNLTPAQISFSGTKQKRRTLSRTRLRNWQFYLLLACATLALNAALWAAFPINKTALMAGDAARTNATLRSPDWLRP